MVMNRELISSALIEIEGVLEKAHDAKNQIQSEIEGGDSTGGLELPREALEGYLEEAAVLLAITLDVAGVQGIQSQLSERWRQFSKSGVGDTRYLSQVDYLESKPLTYLESVIKGVRLFLGNVAESFQAYELAKLDRLLRNSAVLVHQRGVDPKKEHEVQNIMLDYLDAFFPQFTRRVQIPGSIKNFKPDGGIVNLKAAIEFKFAADYSEVTKALSGIFEDVSGYSGSADWTRFYAVVYQTQPFVSEDRFHADFEKANAKNWTPILVNGSGGRAKPDDKGAQAKPDDKGAQAKPDDKGAQAKPDEQHQS
jgi:hypothetical protein